MSNLYNISFTPKAIIGRHDKNGKFECKEEVRGSVVITALPYQTAMRYSKNANFRIEPYIAEHSMNKKKRKSVERNFDDEAVQIQREEEIQASIQEAAETGDMGAAINA